jgi:hypothetical protein
MTISRDFEDMVSDGIVRVGGGTANLLRHVREFLELVGHYGWVCEVWGGDSVD